MPFAVWPCDSSDVDGFDAANALFPYSAELIAVFVVSTHSKSDDAITKASARVQRGCRRKIPLAPGRPQSAAQRANRDRLGNDTAAWLASQREKRLNTS